MFFWKSFFFLGKGNLLARKIRCFEICFGEIKIKTIQYQLIEFFRKIVQLFKFISILEMKSKNRQSSLESEREQQEKEYKERLEIIKKTEIEILDAIRKGDLTKIQSFPFNADGIDTHLCTSVQTAIFPAISKKVLIQYICGPTVVVYSILCEQPEILKFFLMKYNPNLAVDVNGWTPLHFACATKDISCLQILLSTRFFQQNINIKLVSSSSTPQFGATPLHIATMFGLHESVLTLTKPQLSIKIPSPILIPSQNIISTSVRTANGSTPLHLAVLNDDWDMCQILLNCIDCDTSITDQNGKSALDLAKEKHLNHIADQLESGEIEPREDFEHKYLSSYTEEEKKSFDELSLKVQKMKKQVDRIETYANSRDICCICDEELGVLCSECNQYFCRLCWSVPMHRCHTSYS